MKILNSRTSSGTESSQTQLDSTTSQLGFQTTKVSELFSTSELHDDSLIHLVESINGNFQSMKITAHDLKQKLYEAVNNLHRTRYLETHLKNGNGEFKKHSETSPYKEMIKYIVNDKMDSSLTEIEVKSPFIDHVAFDFELLRRYFQFKVNDINDDLDEIRTSLNSIDCMFDPNMVLTHTTSRGVVSNTSINNDTSENSDYCQMTIPNGSKISSQWTCPADGMLVAYGWLDSSEALNSKGIPSSYCVLEAKINERWEIIGVQSIIPSKTITYVGFNAPVHKGLTIRTRTGFSVGAKSGQFSNEQDGFDTLSNSTANGFKCQIFSNSNYRMLDGNFVDDNQN